jgi:signal transduction histidine kinase
VNILKKSSSFTQPEVMYAVVLVMEFTILLLLIIPFDAAYIAVFLFVLFSLLLRWRVSLSSASMVIDALVVSISAFLVPEAALFLFVYVLYFAYHEHYFLLLIPFTISLLLLESGHIILPIQAALAGFLLSRWRSENRRLHEENDKLRQRAYRMEQTELKLLTDHREIDRLSRLNERQEIAQKLHDNLGHEITASNLLVKAGRELLKREEYDKTLSTLDMAKHRLDSAASKLQTAVSQIEPSDETGIETVLNLFRQFIYPVDVSIDGNMSRVPVFGQQLLHIVVQEALTNIARHAEPSYVKVHLNNTGRLLRMSVENDGVTPEHGNTGGANGLRYMRRRIEAVNGSLTIQKTSGRFKIIVLIPGVSHE